MNLTVLLSNEQMQLPQAAFLGAGRCCYRNTRKSQLL